MSADDILVVVEIPHDSEAFRVLKAALLRDTALVRLAVDGTTLKLKRNEGVWTHPLDGATVRPIHTTKRKNRTENKK